MQAGVLASGETETVTVTILPGQSGYPASTRNGVSAASWGAWSGGYSFAGAGAISTVASATSNPYIVESLTTANVGAYSADVTNALGTTRLSAGTVSVGATGSPTLALQPIS